jgi:hypothetical protein
MARLIGSFVLLKLINMQTMFFTQKIPAVKTSLIKLSSVPVILIKGNEKKLNNSWWKIFIRNAEAQQKNRIGWLAFALVIHGCVFGPLTILAIVINGNIFALWIPCIAAFAAAEIVNLAAMPTKITIPVLYASIITDIFVIILSFIL